MQQKNTCFFLKEKDLNESYSKLCDAIQAPYTFATFLCRVRNISTGGVVCKGTYSRMVS